MCLVIELLYCEQLNHNMVVGPEDIYIGASSIGSQLLDEDCSHGWQILATQPGAIKKKIKSVGIESVRVG